MVLNETSKKRMLVEVLLFPTHSKLEDLHAASLARAKIDFATCPLSTVHSLSESCFVRWTPNSTRRRQLAALSIFSVATDMIDITLSTFFASLVLAFTTKKHRSTLCSALTTLSSITATAHDNQRKDNDRQ